MAERKGLILIVDWLALCSFIFVVCERERDR